MVGADADLLQTPINVLRLTLHPRGLAPRIANLDLWRAHVLERLRREVEITADKGLAELLTELRAYPTSSPLRARTQTDALSSIALPLLLRHGDDVLSFLSTTTVFGTPVDVTLAELTLETFFPADAATTEALQAMAAALPPA
jgi:hypothetical protein